MASFERNGNTPHFSIEEPKQICDAVKKKDNPYHESESRGALSGS